MISNEIIERTYYVLVALQKVLFKQSLSSLEIDLLQLPKSEPAYEQAIILLGQVRNNLNPDSYELDARIIKEITLLNAYGNSWEEVYTRLSQSSIGRKNFLKINTSLLELASLLKLKTRKKIDTGNYLDLNAELDGKMSFYKIHVVGYTNEITVKGVKDRGHSFSTNKTNFQVSSKIGDETVYLHNPLREKIVFVKDRFLGERFSKYLVPFMKQINLHLYLCSIETMLGHLVKKYAENGNLNLIAVSKEKYLKEIDDRTLFIVLKMDKNGYKPLEMCYGGIISTVPLVQMQTFAFCAGLVPHEIIVIELNNEFEKYEEKYSKHIFDPTRIALLGWWNESFQRIIESYFHQSLKIISLDLAFEMINYRRTNSLEIDRNIFSGLSKLQKEEFLKGIFTKPDFNYGLRYQFENYLRTAYQEEFTDHSSDYMLDCIMHLLSLTDMNGEEIREEVYTLSKEDSLIRKNDAEYVGKKEGYNDDIKILKSQLVKDKENYNDILRRIKILEDEKKQMIADYQQKFLPLLRNQIVTKLMAKHNLFSPNINPTKKAFFSKQEFLFLKNIFLEIEKIAHNEQLGESIDTILNPIFKNVVRIDIGGKKLYSFPITSDRFPVEFQANELITRGFKTFLFYGTSGGVHNCPIESFVIPKTIYFYPDSYFRIAPEKYVPLPIENILLDTSAQSYFNTDNFYKPKHIFVSATYHEHWGFLNKVLSLFKKEDTDSISVDMDLAPLAKLCMDKNVGFGGILYNTDELNGAEQESKKKGFYIRQLLLSFLRAYESNTFLLNEKDVYQSFNEQFKGLVYEYISDTIKAKQ